MFLWPENWLEPELARRPVAVLQDHDEPAAAERHHRRRRRRRLPRLPDQPRAGRQARTLRAVLPARRAGTEHDVAHVSPAQPGAHRKYYYRRLRQGSWTPWEEIKLDIEDNPVVPYVWNGRLLLFWLQIHQASAPTRRAAPRPATQPNRPWPTCGSASSATRSAQAATTQISEQVSAVLCFSEYYNGKWQPAKTSDTTTRSTSASSPPGTFQRSKLAIPALAVPRQRQVAVRPDHTQRHLPQAYGTEPFVPPDARRRHRLRLYTARVRAAQHAQRAARGRDIDRWRSSAPADVRHLLPTAAPARRSGGTGGHDPRHVHRLHRCYHPIDDPRAARCAERTYQPSRRRRPDEMPFFARRRAERLLRDDRESCKWFHAHRRLTALPDPHHG